MNTATGSTTPLRGPCRPQPKPGRWRWRGRCRGTAAARPAGGCPPVGHRPVTGHGISCGAVGDIRRCVAKSTQKLATRVFERGLHRRRPQSRGHNRHAQQRRARRAGPIQTGAAGAVDDPAPCPQAQRRPGRCRSLWRSGSSGSRTGSPRGQHHGGGAGITGLYDKVTTAEIDQQAARVAASMTIDHPDYGIPRRGSSWGRCARHPKLFSELARRLRDHRCAATGRAMPLVSAELIEVVGAYTDRIDGALVPARHGLALRALDAEAVVPARGRRQTRRDAAAPVHAVAIGIGDDIERVIETYHLLDRDDLASPTMFNAGTTSRRWPRASCYSSGRPRLIDAIFSGLKNCAAISKTAGGIGLAVHNVQATGSYIAGTNGTSNGTVPMLRVYNSAARYVDQAEQRPAPSRRTWSRGTPTSRPFRLKLPTGVEEARARPVLRAVGAGLFMRRVRDDSWSLFCPHECPGSPAPTATNLTRLRALRARGAPEVDAGPTCGCRCSEPEGAGPPHPLQGPRQGNRTSSTSGPSSRRTCASPAGPGCSPPRTPGRALAEAYTPAEASDAGTLRVAFKGALEQIEAGGVDVTSQREQLRATMQTSRARWSSRSRRRSAPRRATTADGPARPGHQGLAGCRRCSPSATLRSGFSAGARSAEAHRRPRRGAADHHLARRAARLHPRHPCARQRRPGPGGNWRSGRRAPTPPVEYPIDPGDPAAANVAGFGSVRAGDDGADPRCTTGRRRRCGCQVPIARSRSRPRRCSCSGTPRRGRGRAPGHRPRPHRGGPDPGAAPEGPAAAADRDRRGPAGVGHRVPDRGQAAARRRVRAPLDDPAGVVHAPRRRRGASYPDPEGTGLWLLRWIEDEAPPVVTRIQQLGTVCHVLHRARGRRRGGGSSPGSAPRSWSTRRPEIAVYNLSSVVLNRFVVGNDGDVAFDFDELHRVVKVLVINMNKIVDHNHYVLPRTASRTSAPPRIGLQVLDAMGTLLRVEQYGLRRWRR